MRVSPRVLNLSSYPVRFTKQSPALRYSLGLSYAAKQSPPFVHPNTLPGTLGFGAKDGPEAQTKIAKWVDGMRALPAGRGELKPTDGEEGDGGWDEELQGRVRKWGAGEDFFAVFDDGNYTHLAASDGVGGWAPQFDPALYSQALMFHYAQALYSSPSIAPWDALVKAYDGVDKDSNVQAGSATAVGVSMSQTGKGRAVNLGDSGLTILRRGQIVFETKAQTHFFNCPYQLSKIPQKMRSSDMITDTPHKADRLEFELEPKDVVILYTDGLSDNLPAEHITLLNDAILKALDNEANAYLSKEEKIAEHARLLADVLVAAGRHAMIRTGDEEDGKGWKTPFEIEARKHRRPFRGGKIDDITVITAVVSETLGA